MLRSSTILFALALLFAAGSCSWPPGAPSTPPVPEAPAERIENRDPGEMPTVPLPEPPPARVPRGVL